MDREHTRVTKKIRQSLREVLPILTWLNNRTRAQSLSLLAQNPLH
jgi:hypothetical protein